ncbi:TPA: multidrug transporter subunit MdtG, partial [Enterococcus faecium]|nr:multidrug transporter subunit MdtG [Enterococcus faecium]
STSLLVLVNFLLVRHNTQEIHQQETAEEKASGVSIASGHSPSHRQ